MLSVQNHHYFLICLGQVAILDWFKRFSFFMYYSYYIVGLVRSWLKTMFHDPWVPGRCQCSSYVGPTVQRAEAEQFGDLLHRGVPWVWCHHGLIGTGTGNDQNMGTVWELTMKSWNFSIKKNGISHEWFQLFFRGTLKCNGDTMRRITNHF